jgi:cell division GTPase FtsZ
MLTAICLTQTAFFLSYNINLLCCKKLLFFGVKYTSMNRKDAIKCLVTSGIAISAKQSDAFTSESKIHFVSLGKAGSHVCAYMKEKGLKASYSNISNYEYSELNHIHFATPSQDNLTGMDGHHTAEIQNRVELTSETKALFNDNDTYVLLSALGGNTGTKLTMELASWLTSKNKNFHIISGLPFKLEAKRRTYAAQAVLNLKNYPNFYYFDNETLRDLYGNIPIVKLFENSANHYFQLAKNIIDKRIL